MTLNANVDIMADRLTRGAGWHADADRPDRNANVQTRFIIT
jgi:hypothetical protein